MKSREMLAILLLAAAMGCGQPDAQPEPNSEPEVASSDASAARPENAAAGTDLTGPPEPVRPPGYESAEALVHAVLVALRKKDEETLQAVRADEYMYRKVLWPEFDRKKKQKSLKVDFHWRMLHIKSTAGIRDALHDYGGHDLELRGIEPEEIEDYGTFKLWRRVKLVVFVPEKQRLARIRVFGSLVEKDGRFWVLGYPS